MLKKRLLLIECTLRRSARGSEGSSTFFLSSANAITENATFPTTPTDIGCKGFVREGRCFAWRLHTTRNDFQDIWDPN